MVESMVPVRSRVGSACKWRTKRCRSAIRTPRSLDSFSKTRCLLRASPMIEPMRMRFFRHSVLLALRSMRRETSSRRVPRCQVASYVLRLQICGFRSPGSPAGKSSRSAPCRRTVGSCGMVRFVFNVCRIPRFVEMETLNRESSATMGMPLRAMVASPAGRRSAATA